jgi:hypothetical protein
MLAAPARSSLKDGRAAAERAATHERRGAAEARRAALRREASRQQGMTRGGLDLARAKQAKLAATLEVGAPAILP